MKQTVLFAPPTDPDWFSDFVAGTLSAEMLSLDQLVESAERCNTAYRKGAPLIDDHRYDHELVAALRRLAPSHPFLNSVEPEPVVTGKLITHAEPMLSTDKAYTTEEIDAFIQRVVIAAQEVGIPGAQVRLRATPKLDGIAGRDHGGVLAKRGNGLRGEDATRIFGLGVVAVGGRDRGPGEIVIEQAYFENEIATQYEMPHPRNFVAGLVDADEVKPHHQAALALGKVRFVPYESLSAWEGSTEEFLTNTKAIVDALRDNVPYLTDGVVIEVLDSRIKAHMGSTSHHHRWQLAIKEKGNTATTTVRGIRLQTGRTGRVTPVVEIDPVHLSGATLRNATAHTARKLAALGLGVGAEIEVIRSGEVIPKIERVLRPAAQIMAVTHCPACGHEVEEDGEYAVCPNTTGCSAQVQSRLEHFFHTLGNVDLFGPATIERLVAGGYSRLEAIYGLTMEGLQDLGFGPGQSRNLLDQMERSRRELVEDWRLVAALGIRHLGRGDSRKLLARFPIEDLGLQTADDIAAIRGFGEITSPLIAEGLAQNRDLLLHLLALDFNLQITPRGTQAATDSPIAGMSIVFTGTMANMSREAMEAEARALGANVQGAVSGKTNLLVTGEKVGASKLNKARANGHTRILTEAEYRHLLTAS